MPTGGITGRGNSGVGDDYSYIGCFRDDASRKVPNLLLFSSTVTVVSCANLANAAGYSYFALQVGAREGGCGLVA